MAKKSISKVKTKTKAVTKTAAKTGAKAKSKPASGKPANKPVKKSTKKTKKTDLTPVIVANYDDVAAKAYEIWLAKGRPIGQDEQNWLEAEAAVAGKKK